MSVQVRRRREAAAFLSTFVGAQGELLVDTTNNRVQVHDGATPGGFPAAKMADLFQRVAVADANYTALATDRTVAFTAITAPRNVALPAASAYPTGTTLVIVDESGSCSSSNSLTVTAAGSDTISGSPSIVIGTAYGYLKLESNGASRWTAIGQPGAAAAAGSSGSSAPAANSVTNAMLAQMSALTLKVNIGASAANPTDSSFSAVADAVFGATRGQVLYRGASGWTALAPGANGTVLTSGGSGTDPSYKAVPAQGPLNNFAATAYPVSANDASQGYAPGSLWLLPATAELYICRDATAGAAVWARTDNAADFFGYVATRWYTPLGLSTGAAGTAPGAGVMKLFPWVNKQRVTLSTVGLRVTTVSSGGSAQVALYATNPATKRPTGTPLAATGSMSTTTATLVNAALGVQIEPGLYWFATNCDNANAAFTSVANTTYGPAQNAGSSSQAGASGLTSTPLAFSYTQAFGTWPDLTGASLTETITNVQQTAFVSFQVASVP